MTDVVTSDKDVIVEVQQPVVPAGAPPVRIGLVEINQVVARGTAWLTGQGPPTGSGGQYGDMYLDVDTGDIYQWDGTKWQKVGNFAPSTDTPQEVLDKLITVDGAGSALDADLLDGQHGAFYAKQTDIDANNARDDLQDGQIATGRTDINNNTSAITGLQNTKANIASPTFTGDPKAPTPTAGDNDTSIATTAFVTAAVAASNVGGPWAPLASPTFSGDPKAPTPATSDNDTSLATTAFVKAQGYLTAVPAGYAPIASPVFTGDPQAPTPALADNDTSIPTTAWVTAKLNALPPSGITDAPSDGFTYGRKNAAWTPVVGGSIVSDTAPTGTLQNGQTWWESDTGNLYIYYNDGDSSQWVMIAAGNPAMPPVAGDLDMKGFSILNDLNFTSTGLITAAAITASGLITPSQSAGIKGITNGGNPTAGAVGEFLQASGTTAYSWGSWGASCSLTLSPGDWDVGGTWGWSSSVGSGTVQTIQTSLSTANGSPTGFMMGSSVGNPVGAGQCTVALAQQRWNSTSSTGVYLMTNIAGSGYTSVSGTGYIWARRAR